MAESTSGCSAAESLGDVVIDLFMNDLQTHGHRQQLLTEEGKKSPAPWQLSTMHAACIYADIKGLK